MWHAETGFELQRSLFDADSVHTILEIINKEKFKQHSVRNILAKLPTLKQWIIPQLRPKVGNNYTCIKSILFTKHPSRNWRVPWHQDLLIQVNKQLEVSGYGPWSIKEGIPHTQAPLSILENIISTRIHLHSCLKDDGALYLQAHSHLSGIIPFAGISDFKIDASSTLVEANPGDVLFMKPLVKHASLANQGEAARAILHLEWCSEPLTHGLHFYEQW